MTLILWTNQLMNFETAHPETSKRLSPKGQPHQEYQEQPSRAVLNSQPPTRSIWWVWLILLVAIGIGGWLFYSHVIAAKAGDSAASAAKKAVADRPIPVTADIVRQGDLPVYLNGLGNVTPLRTVAVHTRVDGQIIKVAYTEGQMVTHDDTFDENNLNDLENPDKDKSTLLVQIDPRPFQVQLEQAKGQLARDQALLANANLDLQRYEMLFKQNSSTDQQVQTQKSLVSQYQGTIEVDQSAIHNAQLQLFYCTLRSPITGRVGLRQVDVGNIVHATDTTPIAVITQLHPITVEFTLPEDDIPQVTRHSHDGTGLQVEVWDRNFKNKLAVGKLEAIDNAVDPGSGTLRLRSEFSNDDDRLFPSQFVNARLLVDTLKNVLIIPTAAVQRSPASTFVYVIKPDQTVEIRNIVVTQTEGNRTAIENGLTPGEQVVTDGVDKLVAGSKVAPHEPPPKGNKGAGATTEPATQPTTQPATRGSRQGRTVPVSSQPASVPAE